MGDTIENTGDNGVFIACIDRARKSGINPTHYAEVIIFLGKEIDRYREKIEHLENIVEKQRYEIVKLQGFQNAVNSHKGAPTPEKEQNETTSLEEVQENTAGEIIKVVSYNDYNISINLFKNDESEVK